MRMVHHVAVTAGSTELVGVRAAGGGAGAAAAAGGGSCAVTASGAAAGLPEGLLGVRIVTPEAPAAVLLVVTWGVTTVPLVVGLITVIPEVLLLLLLLLGAGCLYWESEGSMIVTTLLVAADTAEAGKVSTGTTVVVTPFICNEDGNKDGRSRPCILSCNTDCGSRIGSCNMNIALPQCLHSCAWLCWYSGCCHTPAVRSAGVQRCIETSCTHSSSKLCGGDRYVYHKQVVEQVLVKKDMPSPGLRVVSWQTLCDVHHAVATLSYAG